MKKNACVYSTVDKDVYGIAFIRAGEKLQVVKHRGDGTLMTINRNGFYIRMEPGEYSWRNTDYKELIRELADRLYTAAFNPAFNNPTNGADNWKTIIGVNDRIAVSIDNTTKEITIKKVED